MGFIDAADFKCPECRRPIVSRSNVLCGFCGKALPKELLFTAEERKQVAVEMEELRKRNKPSWGPELSEPGCGGY